MSNVKLYALLYLQMSIDKHIKTLKLYQHNDLLSDHEKLHKSKLEKQLREYEIEYELIRN